MIKRTLVAAAFPFSVVVLGLVVGTTGSGRAVGEPGTSRAPWTTAHVRGTPEPPLPYRVERVFPKLRFRNPVHLSAAPGTARLFVTELAGVISSCHPAAAVDRADPFLDLPRDVKRCRPGDGIKGFRALYALTFHPRFAQNRFCYVCYLVETTGEKPLGGIERVSRFTVADADPPRADPATEKVILEWPTGAHAHNGGCLCFGPDGCLYISTGDGGSNSPPDPHDTGQDVSDLLASVLRINVDREEGGKAYAVPADNPFVQTPGARPEIWAYGFRNPWKMSFDRSAGDLWVGDVGWEMWEMVYRVRRGGNYGWSVMEGRQPVHRSAKRGPTPILPPAFDIPHSEGASLTGGYVYRGKKYPELVGTYVCGDWMTGRIWGTRFEAERLASHQELARGRQRIIAFGEDNDGELYYLGYGAEEGIYALVPNQVTAAPARFPRKLSDTGLYASVAGQTLAPGVLSYAIIAEPWMDHATAERLIALPGLSTVRVHNHYVRVPGTAYFKARLFFPKDAVLARTIALEMECGNPHSRRRLETQLLHFDGHDWNGYSYRWNEEQTDAELIPSGGAECELSVIDAQSPGGQRKQTWRFAGRGECLQCHNGWAGSLLGFMPEQLDRAGQLERLRRLGVLTVVDDEGKARGPDSTIKTNYQLADPGDVGQDLGRRARSYLHINCAHCHQSGGGGAARIDLRFEPSLADTGTLDVPPVLGAFEIANARLLAAGNPYRSVLYYRMAKTGPGRMPHIGSEIVDRRGLDLMHDWIGSLSGGTDDRHRAARASLDTLCSGKGEKIPAIDRLLSTTCGALQLLRALDREQVPKDLYQPVVAAATRRPQSEVRDLFERFLPAEQRSKRLGTSIRPEAILSLKGAPDRGRVVLFHTAGVQCVACHRVGSVGGTLGPDLSQIGKKYGRAKILENLLDPSKEIDPAYVSSLVETADGRLHTGLVVSRDEKEVVVRDAQNKEIRIAADQITTIAPQNKSLMPEQLLRDLTAQQVADLLAYLASLK